MSYIDGFVIAAPTASRQEVIDYAARFDPMFLELGALRGGGCWVVYVPHGTVTDVHRALQAKDDETGMFSWIEWPDQATRDAGMKKMMDYPRLDPSNAPMPLDGKRMIYGGFDPFFVLDAGK